MGGGAGRSVECDSGARRTRDCVVEWQPNTLRYYLIRKNLVVAKIHCFVSFHRRVQFLPSRTQLAQRINVGLTNVESRDSSRVAALVRSRFRCLCRQKPTCTPRGPRAWTSYHNDTLVGEPSVAGRRILTRIASEIV